jgi:hypothetical protein
MKRKDYFKDMAVASSVLIALGTLSLFTMYDASTAWRVIVPTFFFGIVSGIVVNGFLSYKK